MPNVKAINLLCDQTCPERLENRYSSVVTLKLSIGQWPVERIRHLSESLPNLEDLHIRNGWDLDYLAAEGHIQNDPNEVVVGTAFGHWIRKFVKSCTAKVTFICAASIEEVTEPFLMELKHIPNIIVSEICVLIKPENLRELHTLLKNKGSGMSELKIHGAEHLQWSDYELIYVYCTNLRQLSLTFECETSTSPCYPFDFLKGFHSPTVELSVCMEYRFLHDVEWDPLLYRQTKLGFPNIKRLSFELFQFSQHNNELMLLLQDLPNLTVLSLDICKIDRANFETIVRECPNLRSLFLRAVTGDPDEVFERGCFNGLRNLEHFSFTRHHRMTNVTLETLGSLALPLLRSISFDYLGELPPHVVIEICKNCPALEKFCFTEFWKTKQDYGKLKSLLPVVWKDLSEADYELNLKKY